jgi:hypothetical protein
VENEIEEIGQRGLQLLSVELVRRRVEALKTTGTITDRQARRLLEHNQAAEDNRSGRTAFFFTRPQLKDAGLDRLCRSWGGEALYNFHEDDPETGPLLRCIGIPCIVAVAVPVTNIEPRFDVGERLVSVWCDRRRIKTERPCRYHLDRTRPCRGTGHPAADRSRR